MTRLSATDAVTLLGVLDQVARSASRYAPVDERFSVSIPVEELRCMLGRERDAANLEEHLWTVGAMALRDVRTLVYMGRWDIGADLRTFPHDFERLLRELAEMAGDPYPLFQMTSIDWPDVGDRLPHEIWITQRDMRHASGSLEDRARRTALARYGYEPIRFAMLSASMVEKD